MKTIKRKDFTEVGSAVKVHGTKGELKFNLTQVIKIKEWAFLEFRGKPVPFYIEQVKAELHDEVILKLRGIESVEAASAYVGRNLLLPNKLVKKSSTVAALDLVGYTLLDIHLGEIGKVKEVVENQFQSLLIVEHPSGEKMVPLVEELIKGIDEENLILHMELPEGLLDIGN